MAEMIEETDREFARFQATGDPEALACVFDATAHKLLRLAVHLTGDEVGAEDLLQTTFLRILERAHQWDAKLSFLPWANSILANEARMGWRRRRRTMPADLGLRPVPADPTTIAEQSESIDALARAIDALGPEYRQVLKLKLIHGLKSPEIAQLLRIPPETVRTRAARGLARLRQALPAGLAGSAALFAQSRGLAQIRRVVLERASVLRSAGAATGVSLLARFAIGVALVCVAALVSIELWSDTEPVRPSSRNASGSPARSPSHPGDAGETVRRLARGTGVFAADGSPDVGAGPGGWFVHGTVRDERGAAVAGALVLVRILHGCDVSPIPLGRTDREGAYRIAVSGLARLGDLGLRGASLLVDPSAPGHWPGDGALIEGMPADVAATWSARKDFVLMRGNVLFGRVVRADGQPTEQSYVVRVRSVTAEASASALSFVGFEAGEPFRLPHDRQGPLLLEIQCAEGLLAQRLPLLASGVDHDLGIVRLSSSESLVGRFLASDGGPVPYLNFTAERLDGRSGRSQPEWRDGAWQLADTILGRADVDGRFQHQGVAPGRYRLVVTDVLGGEQEFIVNTAQLDATFRLDGQVCAVHVRDAAGRLIPGVQLRWTGVRRVDERASRGLHDISYRGGVFDMLLPFGSRWEFGSGHWRVAAPTVSHEARRGVARARVEVVVGEPQRSGRVELSLRDDTGAAIVDYRVQLRDADGACAGAEFSAEGFAARALPYANYKLEVSSPSRSFLTRAVAVSVGRPSTRMSVQVERCGPQPDSTPGWPHWPRRGVG